jgi:hypothetical protein
MAWWGLECSVPKAKEVTTRTGKEVESNIMLQGHLFDTGFINQVHRYPLINIPLGHLIIFIGCC